MKCRMIGRWLALFVFVVPLVLLGQDGRETDEDDCQSKFNAFRKAKDALENNQQKFVGCACCLEACAESEAFWWQNHMLMGTWAQAAATLGSIAGNLAPSVTQQMNLQIQDLIQGGTSLGHTASAASFIDALIAIFTVHNLEDILNTPQWETVVQLLQSQIDSNQEYQTCMNSVASAKDDARRLTDRLKEQWNEDKLTLDAAIDEIIEWCDSDFNLPSIATTEPDWECPSIPNVGGGGQVEVYWRTGIYLGIERLSMSGIIHNELALNSYSTGGLI